MTRYQHHETKTFTHLVIGNKVFASCNKAESIKHFTQHLENHPGCFEALKWRGRAYCCIKRFHNALDDFQTAERCSEDPYNLLARSEIAFFEGNIKQGKKILHDTMKIYPTCGEAWADLGSRLFYARDHKKASQLLEKSVEIGNFCGDMTKPWYFWSKNTLGEIYFLKGDIDMSEQFYLSAIQCCNVLTNAHIGIGKCSVIKGNFEQAEKSYEVARELNTFYTRWKTFEEFRNHVESNFMGKT